MRVVAGLKQKPERTGTAGARPEMLVGLSMQELGLAKLNSMGTGVTAVRKSVKNGEQKAFPSLRGAITASANQRHRGSTGSFLIPDSPASPGSAQARFFDHLKERMSGGQSNKYSGDAML